MIFLRKVVAPTVSGTDIRFPFNLRMVKSLTELDFTSPVTFFAGENGTGKSTLLEALALAINSVTVGSLSVREDRTMAPLRPWAQGLKLVWNKRAHNGFFLRAEDFFGFSKRISEEREALHRGLQEIEAGYDGRSELARTLAKGPLKSALAEYKSRYGDDLNQNSHGESFLTLFQARLVPHGLYLLDEPETPLSPQSQLAFMAMLQDLVKQGSQFIIASHSPILLAFPGAVIWDFNQTPIQTVPYESLENVNLTKAFLNNPQQFLRHLFD